MESSLPRLLSINPRRRSIKTRFTLRFLRALKKISNQTSSSSSSSLITRRRCRRVKLAADVSMASLVGPRRAWSRAILSQKHSVQGNHNNIATANGFLMTRERRTRRPRRRGVMRSSNNNNLVGGGGRSNIIKYFKKKMLINSSSSGNGVGQADRLRKLVPGGEDMDVYSLLDETAHYIQCLAKQVKVMRTIANTYTSTSTT